MSKVNRLISDLFDNYEDIDRITIKPNSEVIVQDSTGESVDRTYILDLAILDLVSQCPYLQEELRRNFSVVLVRISSDAA